MPYNTVLILRIPHPPSPHPLAIRWVQPQPMGRRNSRGRWAMAAVFEYMGKYIPLWGIIYGHPPTCENLSMYATGIGVSVDTQRQERPRANAINNIATPAAHTLRCDNLNGTSR